MLRTQSSGSSAAASPDGSFATSARESVSTAATRDFLWKARSISALSTKNSASWRQFLFANVYSLQCELGPLSEASLGDSHRPGSAVTSAAIIAGAR